jgi:hypothetical protein
MFVRRKASMDWMVYISNNCWVLIYGKCLRSTPGFRPSVCWNSGEIELDSISLAKSTA